MAGKRPGLRGLETHLRPGVDASLFPHPTAWQSAGRVTFSAWSGGTNLFLLPVDLHFLNLSLFFSLKKVEGIL